MIENYPFISSVHNRVQKYFPEYSVTVVQHTKKLKKLIFNEKETVAVIDAEILERQLALLGENGVFKTAEVWIDLINKIIIKNKKHETGYYNSNRQVMAFNKKYSDGMYVSNLTKKPTEVQIRFAVENTTTVKDAAAYLNLSRGTFLQYAKEICPDVLPTIREKSRKYTVKDPLYNNTPLDELLSGKYPYIDLDKLKKRLLRDCIMEERCAHCGYSLIRENNGRSPLVICFKNSSLEREQLFQLNNLQLLCYNCKYVLEGKNMYKVQTKVFLEKAIEKKIEELPISGDRLERFKKLLVNYTDIIEAKKQDFAKQASLIQTPREINNREKKNIIDSPIDDLDNMFEDLWRENQKNDSIST